MRCRVFQSVLGKAQIPALLFALLILSAGPVIAGEIRRIELKDGSVIHGQIVAFDHGNYTIHSDILGTIRLEESVIQGIRSRGSEEKGKEDSKTPTQSHGGGRGQLLQQLMMADQQTMEMILSLQDNPDFQAVLRDPVIMDAVNRGDIDALLSNPKFLKILESPIVEDIGRKVGK